MIRPVTGAANAAAATAFIPAGRRITRAATAATHVPAIMTAGEAGSTARGEPAPRIQAAARFIASATTSRIAVLILLTATVSTATVIVPDPAMFPAPAAEVIVLRQIQTVAHGTLTGQKI